jgi:hypothetical protein
MNIITEKLYCPTITDDRLAAGVSLMEGAVLIYPSYSQLFPRAKDKRPE